MITEEYLYGDVYALRNNQGIIAFKNNSGISYWRDCIESEYDELYEYTKGRKLAMNAYTSLEFMVITMCAYKNAADNNIFLDRMF